MKLRLKVGLFGLMLLVTAAPVMACLQPNIAMTEAERACCEHMATECGQAQMPASHSCCQRVTAPENLLQQAKNSTSADPSFVLIGIMPVSQASWASPASSTSASPSFRLDEHGPPGQYTGALSVLRI